MQPRGLKRDKTFLLCGDKYSFIFPSFLLCTKLVHRIIIKPGVAVTTFHKLSRIRIPQAMHWLRLQIPPSRFTFAGMAEFSSKCRERADIGMFSMRSTSYRCLHNY